MTCLGCACLSSGVWPGAAAHGVSLGISLGIWDGRGLGQHSQLVLLGFGGIAKEPVVQGKGGRTPVSPNSLL